MRRTMRRTRGGASHQTATSARVLGFDPSLTCSGYSRRLDGDLDLGRIKTTNRRGPDRLYYVRSALRRLLREEKPELVVYEGYAFGAKGNNMFNIGELGGALLLELWEQGIDVLVVPPTTLKQAVTTSGKADKDRMVQAIYDLHGLHIPSHDEADAYALMTFGEAFLAGSGPAEFVKRVRASSSKTELVPGRKFVGCNRLQK